MKLNGFDPESFLAKHWQKTPCILRGVLPSDWDTLDANELAGLALEEDVDSRLVIEYPDRWQVEHGPFDEARFNGLPEDHWTLLVQSVDAWWPEYHQLLEAFRFIPAWRLDDLMVSYAEPGGGVGPHLDQYDVFLVQGQGQRHWRVGSKDQPVAALRPHKDLSQVEAFEPVIDEILQPGDVLYIPPNTPHWGVAKTQCLTYSVGFRAPSERNLYGVAMEHWLEAVSDSKRYTDPHLKSDTGDRIPQQALKWSEELLATLNKRPELLHLAFAQLVTTPKIPEVLPEPLDLSLTEVTDLLEQGESFVPVEAARMAWFKSKGDYWLAHNGELLRFSHAHLEDVRFLCTKPRVTKSSITVSNNPKSFVTFLQQLVASGCFQVDTEQ